jgi:hypothetical protein
MRFYSQQHRFYCGIDLHARSMHVCVLDQAGEVVFDRNLPARPESLLRAGAPCRDDLIVGVECMFAWYWVADLCRAELLTHLQILNAQYNLAPFPKKLSFAAHRPEMKVAERFADPSVHKSAAVNLALVNRFDDLIAELELYLVRTAKVDDVQT